MAEFGARQIRLTNLARIDLDGIFDYTLARWGKPQALKYQDALWSILDHLSSHPEIGRAHDAELGIRVFVARSHRVYYSTHENEVTILRIVHHRRAEPQFD